MNVHKNARLTVHGRLLLVARVRAQRLRRCGGWVIAVVDDAGARDIILSTKDADHSVIELSGIARQMRTVAKGVTA